MEKTANGSSRKLWKPKITNLWLRDIYSMLDIALSSGPSAPPSSFQKPSNGYGDKHIQAAHELYKTHSSEKSDSLVLEVAETERALNGGTFVQIAPSEERRSILAAKSKG